MIDKTTKMHWVPVPYHAFPRNSADYHGGMVLFHVKGRSFIKLEWGCGDNLTKEDRAEGYDDYINWEVGKWTGGPISRAFSVIRQYEGVFEDLSPDREHHHVSVKEDDGGILLVKRCIKELGDIRAYIDDVYAEYLRGKFNNEKVADEELILLPMELLFVCQC